MPPVRVGRWMGRKEYEAMLSSGTVQESYSGTTHVTFPASPNSFHKPSQTSIYVEFDVPDLAIVKTQEGWAKIIGPNTIQGRNAKRKGQPVPQMPQASSIQLLIP
ncbi:hypothetical protein [Gloeobacter kilaueensis]|uniref:TreTu toxin C-terminal domain-containing protein n=1 Tax=Gloeobacter kilaueensis (strain ATCC BAA-2537 / CCAP 1431/1 / ULC 316 / JS1) TaxID=1183438 RepID=U5QGC9_GLOK1|nr:hypothetical protein GKIL_0448 [Gloeobacter kilaueensis JS1]